MPGQCSWAVGAREFSCLPWLHNKDVLERKVLHQEVPCPQDSVPSFHIPADVGLEGTFVDWNGEGWVEDKEISRGGGRGIPPVQTALISLK